MYLIDRKDILRAIYDNKYGEHEAVMELINLNIIDGSLPKKCRQLVREWAELRQDELIEMWDTQIFHTISPLGVKNMKLKHFEHLRWLPFFADI